MFIVRKLSLVKLNVALDRRRSTLFIHTKYANIDQRRTDVQATLSKLLLMLPTENQQRPARMLLQVEQTIRWFQKV